MGVIVPNSWGSPLWEANTCHNPAGHPEGGGRFCSKKGGDGGEGKRIRPSRLEPPDGETVTLYRGDAKKVNPSLAYADPNALFGPGIYLSSSKRIAGDYRAKGGGYNEGVVFRYGGGAKSKKQDAIDAYVRTVAKTIDAEGNKLDWPKELPALVGHPEREARLEHARRIVNEKLKGLEIRKSVDGTIVFRRKEQPGALSSYKIPKSWIKKTLDAEGEISIDVADAMYSAFRDYRHDAGDLYDFATRRDADGFRPTFRDVYRRAAQMGLAQVAAVDLRRELKALGYKGIRYAGGVTMGGGHKHEAYVFWDEQGLLKRRVK